MQYRVEIFNLEPNSAIPNNTMKILVYCSIGDYNAMVTEMLGASLEELFKFCSRGVRLNKNI